MARPKRFGLREKRSKLAWLGPAALLLITGLLLAPSRDRAQYYKTGMALSYQGRTAVILPGASIMVCKGATTTIPCNTVLPLATLVSNNHGVQTNPFATDAAGNYWFSVALPGAYTWQVSATGFATTTMTEQIGAPTIDMGSQLFNVLAYGADQNFTIDSSAAVTTAISAAGNGRIYFPCGHYKFSGGSINLSGTSVLGEGAQGNGSPCVLLEWTNTSSPPSVGLHFTRSYAADDTTILPEVKGIAVKNSTGNSSFIGIQGDNQSLYFDSISMVGAMTCVQILQNNGSGTERSVFGPGVWLNCTMDIDLMGPGSGTGSVAYTRILGANLDTNSLKLENGAQCFGCTLNFHFNVGGGTPTIITLTGSGTVVLNSTVNIQGEQTAGTCSTYNLGAGTTFQAIGHVRSTCTGANTRGAGAHWLVFGEPNPPDGYVPGNSDMGQYPSATYTTNFSSSQRMDLPSTGTPAAYSQLFGASSNSPWDVYGVTFSSTAHEFQNCWELWQSANSNPFASSSNKTFGVCGDGHTMMKATTFSAAPACGTAVGAGAEYVIGDSTTATLGAVVTGGGSHTVKMFCNGTNWTVEAAGTGS